MVKIKSIEHIENRGKYALIHVKTDEEDSAVVYVGGEIEVYFDDKYNKIKAFVKRNKDAS